MRLEVGTTKNLEAFHGPEEIGLVVKRCGADGLLWAPQEAEGSVYGRAVLARSKAVNHVLPVFVALCGLLVMKRAFRTGGGKRKGR